MPTDEEVAELREREKHDPSLSPAEGAEETVQPRGEAARAAMSAGCFGYLAAALLVVVGVLLMTAGQAPAILLILVAVGIGFWSRSKLKEAAPNVR